MVELQRLYVRFRVKPKHAIAWAWLSCNSQHYDAVRGLIARYRLGMVELQRYARM
jgi:hypothetical protein